MYVCMYLLSSAKNLQIAVKENHNLEQGLQDLG